MTVFIVLTLRQPYPLRLSKISDTGQILEKMYYSILASKGALLHSL